MSYGYGDFKRYVPAHERRWKAEALARKAAKPGHPLEPVTLATRTIATTFWGKGWCQHLESFSDYANRLPRGRTYVRNGSVCHLAITDGHVEAMVTGTKLYKVQIDIAPLDQGIWASISRHAAGQIDSLLELLQGKLPKQVMQAVTNRDQGLFPLPGQMRFKCSCPDWASMCKHVAAVLYGVGHRLDQQPQLLFQLRGVEPGELIGAGLKLPAVGTNAAQSGEPGLEGTDLASLFGIDLVSGVPMPSPKHNAMTAKRAAMPARKKTVPQARTNRAPSQPAATMPSQPWQPTPAAIVALRKKLGLSVAQFANRLGVTTTTIDRWETPYTRINLHPKNLDKLVRLHAESDAEPPNRASRGAGSPHTRKTSGRVP